MRRILLALAAAVLLAACGGNGNNDQNSGGAQTTMDQGMHMSSSTQPPAGDATRTIKVIANDKLCFQLATLSVKRGETVAFTVINTGKLVHEFVIGDQAFQERHEKEMMGRAMPMADDADGVGLLAGATKKLIHTFRQAMVIGWSVRCGYQRRHDAEQQPSALLWPFKHFRSIVPLAISTRLSCSLGHGRRLG